MIPAVENPQHLAALGNTAYQAGLNHQAVALFRRAAELALEQNDVAAHVHNLRWTGNALIWAGQADEACTFLLQAVSFDGQPEAEPEDVYGALTDLCMVALRSRPYALLRRMLADARDFLRRRRLDRWGHRLDLLQAMAHLRQRDYAQAFPLASRAWQGVRAVGDGPRYHFSSYLNVVFRAAHSLGDGPAMDRALDELHRHSERDVMISRVRHRLCQALRLTFDGLSDTRRDTVECLVDEVIGVMSTTEWVHDDTLDVLRLLAMLGRHDQARQHLQAARLAGDADLALLELDIALCRLAGRSGWSPPFYIADGSEIKPPRLLEGADPCEQLELAALLEQAVRHGQDEDARRECSLYIEAVARRRSWLALPDAA
jgi:hypothetical protein